MISYTSLHSKNWLLVDLGSIYSRSVRPDHTPVFYNRGFRVGIGYVGQTGLHANRNDFVTVEAGFDP